MLCILAWRKDKKYGIVFEWRQEGKNGILLLTGGDADGQLPEYSHGL